MTNNWKKRSDGSFINDVLASKAPLTNNAIGEAKDRLSGKDTRFKKDFLIYLLKRIAENSQHEGKFLIKNIEFAIFLLKYPDKELRNAAISIIKSFASNGKQTYGENLILERVKKELTIYIKEKVEEKVERNENKNEEKQKIRKLIEQKLESDNKGKIRRDIREALGFPSEGKNWLQKLILNFICDKKNVLGIIDTLLDSISPKPEVVQEHESSRSSSDHGNDNHEESGGVGDVVPDNSHKRGCFSGFSLSSLCSVQVPHIDDDKEEENSNALVTGENEGLDAGAQEEEISNASVADGDEGLYEGTQSQGGNRSTGSDQEEISKASVTDEDKVEAGTTRAEARGDDSDGVEEGGVEIRSIKSIKDRIATYTRGLGKNNRPPSPPPSTSPPSTSPPSTSPPSTSPTGTGLYWMKEAHGQAVGL